MSDLTNNWTEVSSATGIIQNTHNYFDIQITTSAGAPAANKEGLIIISYGMFNYTGGAKKLYAKAITGKGEYRFLAT